MSIEILVTKPEFYYWFLIPTLIEFIVLFFTIKFTKKRFMTKNIIFLVIILFLLVVSQLILIEIFFYDSWPTYIPHIAIFFCVLLVIIQYLLNRKNT